MATRSKPAKPRATRAAKTVPSKSSAAPPMSTAKVSAGSAGFGDIGDVFRKMQVPGVDLDALLEARRRDIEALVAANQEMYKGMRALAMRQTELAQETFREWQNAVQSAPQGRPAANFGAQSELAQKAFGKALGNLRELAELAAESQSRVYDLMKKRSAENLEEMRRLMKGK
jgi:phasin family protein